MALQVLIRGVVLGLGAAAPIGPVNVEMAKRALSRGWAHGVALGLGAVSIDVLYATAAVAGVSVAAGSPYLYWPIAIAGTLFLLYLAYLSFRSAKQALATGWELGVTEGPAPSLAKVYATGVAMTASNPMTLAFWFGGLTSQAMTQSVSKTDLKFLAAGVFLGTVAWVLSFSTVMAFLGRFRRPWWMAVADLAGGVVLLGFAGFSIFKAFHRAH